MSEPVTFLFRNYCDGLKITWFMRIFAVWLCTLRPCFFKIFSAYTPIKKSFMKPHVCCDSIYSISVNLLSETFLSFPWFHELFSVWFRCAVTILFQLSYAHNPVFKHYSFYVHDHADFLCTNAMSYHAMPWAKSY